MHRPLNRDLVARLESFTPAFALKIPPGHALTAWHKRGLTYPSDYTRCAWDPEGDSGLYGTWFPVGRVHWVPDEGCWRWQAFYPGGARSGLSDTECDLHGLPLRAMRRVDAYLELYGLWPDELRGTMTTKHAPEPRLDPTDSAVLLTNGDHVLSEWSRLKSHAGGAQGDRYVRVWLHTAKSRAALSPSDRTEDLAQRVFPGKPHAVTLVQPSRGRWWTWEIRGGGRGNHQKKNVAARRARNALLSWGVKEAVATVLLAAGDRTFIREAVGV